MRKARLKEEEMIALFRNNLRMAMSGKGLKQKELAALSGLTEAQVSSYLKGRSEPGIRSICRMAAALGISPSLLLCSARERLIMGSPCWNEEGCGDTIAEGEKKA